MGHFGLSLTQALSNIINIINLYAVKIFLENLS